MNHEAWAIPYGDLITLLLAFFVVMYALSSVNEGKFRILSESLQAAFRGAPMAPEPIQVGRLARGVDSSPVGDAATMLPITPAIPRFITGFGAEHDWYGGQETGFGDAFERESWLEVERGLQEIADQIQKAVTPLIEADLIRIRRERFWLEVEINTSFLFASGSAEIFLEARPILGELAGILKDLPVRVNVEGFTDDVPINTPVFPSNWELSSGRASSVLRLLVEEGLDPTRMAAIGFGEHRPVADNATAEGRRQNRRVTIVVLADQRPGVDDASAPLSRYDEIDRTPAAPEASGSRGP